MTRNQKTAGGAAAIGLLLALGLVPRSAQGPQEPSWHRLREQMVRQTLENPTDGRQPVRNPRVLDALRRVPRHEFVPPGLRPHAYADRPLPIGHDQTISQPYIVGIMTELLEPKPTDRVLEVGTGSGYQAAVLAELVQEVYSLEIVAPLAEEARERLRRLGYGKVQVRVGDGYLGWPEQAPFDAILVTAWATHLPPPLLEQLKPGGRLVIPAGDSAFDQELLVVHRGRTAGELRVEHIMPVRFVPLTGEHARPDPPPPDPPR